MREFFQHILCLSKTHKKFTDYVFYQGPKTLWAFSWLSGRRQNMRKIHRSGRVIKISIYPRQHLSIRLATPCLVNYTDLFISLHRVKWSFSLNCLFSEVQSMVAIKYWDQNIKLTIHNNKFCYGSLAREDQVGQRLWKLPTCRDISILLLSARLW